MFEKPTVAIGRVNIMRDNFRNTIVLSVVSCILSFASLISYADENAQYKTGMTRVGICSGAEVSGLTDDKENTNDNIQEEGNDEDNNVLIEPGVYLIYGAKQLRITDADNRIVLFKGKQNYGEALKAELPSGGTLEYMGSLYMTRFDEEENNEVSEESKAKTLNPLEYSPIYSMSLLSLAAGGYTEINDGRLNVYNKNGELKSEVYIPYISEISGYILDEGIGSDDSGREEELYGDTITMEPGRTYTVGTDLNASKYLARGSGTVRVYDAEGYVKTVIKLKKTDTPGNEGVESYKFSLDLNNTVITEGSIDFAEIYKFGKR